MMRGWLAVTLLMTSGVCGAGMMGGGMMGGGMMAPGGAQSSEPPKTADQETDKGYALTQEYCIQCHQPPNPRQHTAREWPQVVVRMEGYMQRQGRTVPSQADSRLIIEYLEKNANDSR